MKAETSSQHRAIWRIAWPMMLCSMSVPLLGLVDTALLGHLESASHLGAVALGANIMGLLYLSFNFLRMSTTGLTAIAIGSSEAKSHLQAQSTDAIVFRALLISLILGLVILAAAPALSSAIVNLMQASKSITPLTLEYIGIRKYSAAAVFMTFAISGWLIGQNRTREALVIVLITNLINIVLDIWFIAFLGLEARGAAFATICAEWTGLFIGLAFLYRYSQIFQFSSIKRWSRYLGIEEFRMLLATNFHLLVRTVLLMFVLNFFTARGSVYGDTILAANAILLQLVLLSAYVIDGFSYAAEVLCGQAYGAGNSQKVNLAIRHCLAWGGFTGLIFALCYFLAPLWLINILTDIPEVVAASAHYMDWAIVATAAGFIAYLMDGACIGTNRSAAMNYSMCFSALAVFFPVWWLTQPLANDGLWLAFLLFTLARGISLGGYWLFVENRPLEKRAV